MSIFQHPESSVQSPASSVQSPDSSFQCPESSVQSSVSKVQHPGSSVQSPASRAQSLEYSVQLLRLESRNSDPLFLFCIRNIEFEYYCFGKSYDTNLYENELFKIDNSTLTLCTHFIVKLNLEDTTCIAILLGKMQNLFTS